MAINGYNATTIFALVFESCNKKYLVENFAIITKFFRCYNITFDLAEAICGLSDSPVFTDAKKKKK